VHVSLAELSLKSSHGVPLGSGEVTHNPRLQVEEIHADGDVHTTPRQGSMPIQTPPLHASLTVLALPSSHVVPFALFDGAEHKPVAELH